MIRLASPEIPEEDLQAVREVLASGWLVQGERVAAFERSVATFLGTEHAVAVTSGTSALHTALLAAGIGSGDAVAVSAYSHVASANVIELCGAEPVFIDIDRRTFNMDPEELTRVLRERADAGLAPVSAILVVHAFGQMADLDSIGDIASGYAVPVIEDAACALGASWAGRKPGATTLAACFSFHPRKAITTGEGGMIATDDTRLATASRTLRNHGQDPASTTIDFVLPGLNYRMTEFQATLGSAALQRLEEGIAARRRLAARYDALLSDCVDVPYVPPSCAPVYQSYVVLLPESAAASRPALIEQMRARGVETTIGTWSIPTTSYYRRRYGYDEGTFPVTSEVFARSLALPMHEKLSADDQSHVSEALHAALDEWEAARR
jgi:dTDP-4-amino-4,6-dideoxygalactose transaminase